METVLGKYEDFAEKIWGQCMDIAGILQGQYEDSGVQCWHSAVTVLGQGKFCAGLGECSNSAGKVLGQVKDMEGTVRGLCWKSVAIEQRPCWESAARGRRQGGER